MKIIITFQADDISDKEMLFSKTDIADWILPAIYMGHIERVVWIKPPWAEQILDGPHRLCLGRDKNSGQLRSGFLKEKFLGWWGGGSE